MPPVTSSENITTEDILDSLLKEDIQLQLREGEITIRMYIDYLYSKGLNRGWTYTKNCLDKLVKNGKMTKRKVLTENHWEWAYKKV